MAYLGCPTSPNCQKFHDGLNRINGNKAWRSADEPNPTNPASFHFVGLVLLPASDAEGELEEDESGLPLLSLPAEAEEAIMMVATTICQCMYLLDNPTMNIRCQILGVGNATA